MDDQHEILTLIVEDDPLNSTLLRDLLLDHFPQIRVVGIAATIAEATPLLKCVNFDLLFLDIELPDGKGFDLLATLPEVKFEVIITTSFSNYAIDAIRHSALDFILKPVCIDDLTHAIERLSRKLEAGRHISAHPAGAFSHFHRLPLPTAEGLIFVNTDDIVHVSADGSYTVFALTDGRKIIVSKPLHEYEQRLLSRNFFRVHNSHIINLALVLKYFRGEGGHVLMTGNISIPVSRSRKEEFLHAIGS